MCSFNRMAGPALVSIISSLAFRPSSGSGVVAVQLDQVEGIKEHFVVSAVVSDEIKRSHAVSIAGDSFATVNARAGAQPG
jgi:hypothetical protein